MEQQPAHYRQILVTSAETNGAFGLIACTLPPFSPGPGLCRHEGQLADPTDKAERFGAKRH
jgi:hypothetical protein